MKRYLIFLLILFTCKSFGQQLQTINPVIGDESYLVKYGTKPTPECDETDRIRTHLSYVEEQLRASDVSGLTAEQVEKRTKILDHLHDYWQRGQFPVNSKYENQRRPCFIDENGTICAVGYLVEQTAGLAAAEAINEQYQYATIAEMTDKLPEIERWAIENGLTINECAMIQPTYVVIRVARNQIGAYAGYAGAFAIVKSAVNGSSIQPGAGFEFAMTDSYGFPRLRLALHTSVGINSRNYTVKAFDESFHIRNDRWFLSSLVSTSPFTKGPAWLRRFAVKLGAQVNFYDLTSPQTVYRPASSVTNTVIKTRKPEVLVVGEITYPFKPWLNHMHAISVSYSHGSKPTMEGIITKGNTDSEAFRYTDAGSYWGIKYTFWVTKAFHRSM